jgi:excisionase family DNA binding protein
VSGTKQSPEPLRIEPALLTIPQVCSYLNIARATFYKLNATGAFGLLRVPLCSKQLFSRLELEAWVRAGCPHRKQWRIMKKENGL